MILWRKEKLFLGSLTGDAVVCLHKDRWIVSEITFRNSNIQRSTEKTDIRPRGCRFQLCMNAAIIIAEKINKPVTVLRQLSAQCFCKENMPEINTSGLGNPETKC